MEPPSDPEIAGEYENRRLSKLRDFAHVINDELKRLPVIPGSWIDKIANLQIDKIEESNSDKLYFSILARIIVFPRDLSPMPQELGYGFHYDKLFRAYSDILTHNQSNDTHTFYISKNTPYLMLSNPDRLYLAYSRLYSLHREQLANALSDLKNGNIARDLQIDTIISQLDRRIEAANKARKNIIDMMISGEFDVLDTIYIILYMNSPDTILAQERNKTELPIVAFINYVLN